MSSIESVIDQVEADRTRIDQPLEDETRFTLVNMSEAEIRRRLTMCSQALGKLTIETAAVLPHKGIRDASNAAHRLADLLENPDQEPETRMEEFFNSYSTST